ncbi:MAG: aminotransferase class III-fold pyridoxal phosphate-dependent enzyme [Candidatus Latescibacterota bacterium]|nr:aminotransferase class III-fold pyridoxal phosphate-dependent enzyme [Candidatus Latescibacterota bacterium]
MGFLTEQSIAKAEKYLAGATLGMFKLPNEHPLVLKRGQGCTVWDIEGREYVDYVLGSGPMILGHSNPAVVDAVTQQVGMGTTFYGLNQPAIDLAEQIVAASPCAEQVRFASSGTEGTFSAIRLARAFTGKEKILKFDGGWHGGHDYAQQDADPSRPGLSRPISDGIPRGATDTVLCSDFNDAEAAERIISENANDLAAVIVEPLQRAIAPVDGFLTSLRASTAAQGTLLIMDEVVTGFRLAWGGAQEYYDVIPDLVVYGKTISGGYPLSAVCGRADIINCAAPEQKGSGSYAFISGTFNGNPISCTAGIATLKILGEDGVYSHLHEVSRKLKHGLTVIGNDLGFPLQVIGEGPVLQPFFTKSPIRTHADSQNSDAEIQKAFGLGMIKEGYFVNPTGKLYLSTVHTSEIIDRTLEAASNVLTKLAR